MKHTFEKYLSEISKITQRGDAREESYYAALKEKYDEKKKVVWVNDHQCFTGIPPEVWTYHIGGYQVLDKWLKDRKGRTLSNDDIRHYCHVATALSETMKLQKEIDAVIEKHGGWPIGQLPS